MNLHLMYRVWFTTILAFGVFFTEVSANSHYGFIQNKGQILDQHFKPNKEVLFLYSGNGLNVHLKQNSFCYEWDRVINESIHIQRIDIRLNGSSPNPEIIADEKSNDYLNFYTVGTGEAGVVQVHHYRRILYRNIYPDIDLEFLVDFENKGRFKYNFLVHPEGKPELIQLAFSGADHTFLKDNGSIILETDHGIIEENIPLSYQMDRNEKVSVSFRGISSGVYGFSVGSYNTTKLLTIDPAPWATYFGGGNTENGNDLVKDHLSNLILAGVTNSQTNIATNGAFKTILSGTNYDAFIAKFNSSGSRIWCTYYGGIGLESGRSVTVDLNDNIFVTGETSSDSFIATSGAFQTLYMGNEDAFVLKLSPAGNRIWSTYFGAGGAENVRGIATDSWGNVGIIGSTTSTSGIVTSAAYQPTFGGGYNDTYIAKFNSTGSRLWATYIGGGGLDNGYGVNFDQNGDVLATGTTNSNSGIATTGSYQSAIAGSSDAFVIKLNPSGSICIWATYYGGTAGDEGRDITTDTERNVCVTGWTRSSTGIASVASSSTDTTSVSYAAFQRTYSGGYTWGDAFVVKFDTIGRRLWGTYYGGLADDWGMGIITDDSLNVLFIGTTRSTSGIASTGTYQTIHGGGWYDAFFVKFNPIGVRHWASYFGGNDDEYAMSITTDSNIFICGTTGSTTNIASPGAYQTTLGGNGDAFLASFTITGNGPLPVSLLNLNATRQSKNAVLFWTTSSERNSDRFEVQRQLPEGSWQHAGTVMSFGNSDVLQSYQFSDKLDRIIPGMKGSVYYRLKIIDVDGSYTFSKTVKLSLEDLGNDIISVYPNPFADELVLHFNTNMNGEIIVKLRNIYGQVVLEKAVRSEPVCHLKTGEQSLPIGVYFLSVESAGQSTHFPVIKTSD